MRSLLAIVAVVAFAFGCTATASANDRFTLDTAPGSPGHVVVDPTGTAYVAWTHRSGSGAPDSVMFCKVPQGGSCASPQTLQIPGAVDHTGDPAGVFPVFGEGTTVFVVAPRFAVDDIVIWKSVDGGQTFGPGVIAPEHAGYPGQSNPTSVEFAEHAFFINAFNPGVGIGAQPETGAAGTNLTFATAGPGTIGGAGGGLIVGKPSVAAEVYWTLDAPYQMYFYAYEGAGKATMEASWAGPTLLGGGYETKVAAGTSGIYVVSQDYAGGSNPSAVDVRRFNGTSFDAPVSLANDSATDLFAGGAIAESPSGHVAVAWPTGDAHTMRLFTSSDGTDFTQTNIAHIGGAYSIGDNAQLGIADSGAGWLTYMDERGLQMADLTPIAEPPAKVPPYKGKEKTVGTRVGGFELTLRLPRSCLQPGQPFYAGAGKRVRHKVAKAVHAKLTLKSATFTFDGKKLRTLKKKPLKLLISPGALAPGSKHTVTVRITAVTRGHGAKPKKVVRTLKGTISIC